MRYLFLFLFLPFFLNAQSPVQWTWSVDRKSNEISFKVHLDEGWHLYSQYIQNDIGPVPTSFTFHSTAGLELIGAVQEPTPIKKYDENFEATLDFFEKDAIFYQKYKGEQKGTLSGIITYMVCNDKMCLPPVDQPFTITIE